MKPLAALLLLTLGLALVGCSRGRVELTAHGLLARYGLPICHVSGYDHQITGDKGWYKTSLYAVGADAAIRSLESLPLGTLLVFTDDERLKASARGHFESLSQPHNYTGSTMFVTRGLRNGTAVHIVKVTGAQSYEAVFEEGTTLVYFEVGTPGNLIRQPAARR